MPARAGRLQVDVDECPCRAGARLASRLETELEPRMAARSSRTLRVSRVDAGTLRVALSGEAETYESTIAFRPEDCGELGETLRLLVASWLESEPLAAAPEPQPEPEPQPPTPVVQAAVADAPRWAFGLVVGGGSEVAPQRAVAAASLEVERGLSRAVSAGLSFRYEAPATSRFDEGRWRIDSAVVAAPLGWRLPLASGLAIDLLAGPALRLSRFRAAGFDRNFSRTVADFAVLTGPRLRLEVAPTLFAVAVLDALARTRTDRLLFGGTGASARVGSIRLRAGVGVSWEAF